MRSADTSPDSHARQLAAYQAMSPGERIELALAMSEEALAIAASGIAARHPDYGEEDVRRALLRLRWGDELYTAVFPGERVLDP